MHIPKTAIKPPPCLSRNLTNRLEEYVSEEEGSLYAKPRHVSRLPNRFHVARLGVLSRCKRGLRARNISITIRRSSSGKKPHKPLRSMWEGNGLVRPGPDYREIVSDIAFNWRAPAECMPKRALIRGASDEADNDRVVEAEFMLSKPGFELAVSPQHQMSHERMGLVAVRLPFQEEVLRTNFVWCQEWDACRIFKCSISLPVRRNDDESIVCYNGSILQHVQMLPNFQFVLLQQHAVAHRRLDQELSRAFAHTSEQFVLYLKSIHESL